MDLDYKAAYQVYSNAELLRIIAHPENFRPPAIEAAMSILATRNVTDEDKRLAGYDLSPIPEAEAITIETAEEETGIFHETAEELSSRFKTIRTCVIVLLGLLTLPHLFIAVATIYDAVTYVFYEADPLAILFRLSICAIVYTGLFLFARLHKAGWVITTIVSLLLVINYIVTIVTAFATDNGRLFPLQLLLLSVSAGMVLYLGKPEVYLVYKIDEERFQKYRTGAVVLALFVLLMLFMLGKEGFF